MKKSTIFLAMALYLASGAANAQSLGDLAREEQNRRDAIPEENVITVIQQHNPPPAAFDEKIAKEALGEGAYGETENTQIADADSAEGSEGDPGDPSKEADPNELTDMFGNTESYWRAAMSEATGKVAQLEAEESELASRHRALTRQLNTASGLRRGPVRGEIDIVRFEQDLNKNALEQAREELQALRSKARSSGALPGWIQ